MTVTSGRAGFRFALFELLLFLLFEVILVRCVRCVAGHFGWWFLSQEFSGCLYLKHILYLSYFEMKLQKPGGPVCQGNLSVYLILHGLN